MNSIVRLLLSTTPAQAKRLADLQKAFAAVCNTLAPLVQQTHCWNRVALHHMAYKQLRQQFPGFGSQMVCNAIYSVSRAARVVYQHPQSTFNAARLNGKPLPLLQFLPQSPVYFDRHTLSIKDGQASMYTLDGRMRFQVNLSSEDEQRFRTEKLREVVLSNAKDGTFQLGFHFADGDPQRSNPTDADLPEYVLVTEDPAVLLPPPQSPLAPSTSTHA